MSISGIDNYTAYMYIYNAVGCNYCKTSNISYTLLSRHLNCWSLRCSWSIACRRCSNYIFILDLTPSFNGLGKDNCKTRPEIFKFWDLVCLILEVWRYSSIHWVPACCTQILTNFHDFNQIEIWNPIIVIIFFTVNLWGYLMHVKRCDMCWSEIKIF